MRIGRMNHPCQDVGQEIALAARLGFDYLELTLEPPCAEHAGLSAGALARRLSDAGLGVMGHTAYYLPITDPFPRVRQAAVDQLRGDLDFLAELGCDRCTVHPHRGVPLTGSERERLLLCGESFAQLDAHGRDVGVRVLLENLPEVGDPELLKELIFDRLPGLGLTLDVAHAALQPGRQRVPDFLRLLPDRLAHVHVCDNDGLGDRHQPLGAGRLPLREMVHAIRATGYDDGFTLEVFTALPRYQQVSREVFAEWWNET